MWGRVSSSLLDRRRSITHTQRHADRVHCLCPEHTSNQWSVHFNFAVAKRRQPECAAPKTDPPGRGNSGQMDHVG
jgi:hypothetical protein